jgi:hypothetical protein
MTIQMLRVSTGISFRIRNYARMGPLGKNATGAGQKMSLREQAYGYTLYFPCSFNDALNSSGYISANIMKTSE